MIDFCESPLLRVLAALRAAFEVLVCRHGELFCCTCCEWRAARVAMSRDEPANAPEMSLLSRESLNAHLQGDH